MFPRATPTHHALALRHATGSSNISSPRPRGPDDLSAKKTCSRHQILPMVRSNRHGVVLLGFNRLCLSFFPHLFFSALDVTRFISITPPSSRAFYSSPRVGFVIARCVRPFARSAENSKKPSQSGKILPGQLLYRISWKTEQLESRLAGSIRRIVDQPIVYQVFPSFSSIPKLSTELPSVPYHSRRCYYVRRESTIQPAGLNAFELELFYLLQNL